MNRFIGSLAIVTTLSNHNYKVAMTHIMNTTDYRSLPLLTFERDRETSGKVVKDATFRVRKKEPIYPV
jgi:hypothetical protein